MYPASLLLMANLKQRQLDCEIEAYSANPAGLKR
jgi:hypothetical protein